MVEFETISGEAILLRIFMGESDRWEGNTLYNAIVMEARKKGLAGATVIRGIQGYGATRHFHAAHLLELSGDLPIILEIADTAAKIEEFLPLLEEITAKAGCLITLENIRIFRHQTAAKTKT